MIHSMNYDLPHYTEKFIRHLKRDGASKDTITAYQKDLKIFNQFIYTEYKGLVLLEQLQRHDLQDYLAFIHEDKKYHHNTVQRHLSSLKAFYRFLVNEMNFPVNIAASIRHKGKYTPLPPILTEVEIKQLLQTASDYKFYYYMLISTLYYTGSRITATLEIEKGNIDEISEKLYFSKIKGGRDHYLPTHEKLIPILKQFLANHPAPDSPFLFHSPRNPMKHLQANTARIQLKKIAEQAGIEKRVTPHILRHSMATHLTLKGAGQRVLMDILGHTDPRATARYQQLVVENLRDPLNTLS